MSEGDVSVNLERPLKQSREAWNAILARYDTPASCTAAVERFIYACHRHGEPLALAIAGDLAVRLAISRKMGFKPWPPASE